MARRKKGQPVHGWVIVDKPQGVTSTQVVGAVRRIFDAQKAGHAGTLDPMATGVLAVALGEATKTVPFAMDADKTYRFTAHWGEARDTDDAEGRVTATSDVRPTREQIEAMLPRFTGELTQTPPAYSAIKVQGERAYDLAREGEAVELAPRNVEVYEARLVEIPDPDHAVFEILCGKGTYVRAWVRDLALALGTVGHVSQLRRTRVGAFEEKDSCPLAMEGSSMHIPAAFEHLRPIATALDGIPALAVTGPDAVRLRSGNPILIRANQFARIAESQPEGDDLQGLSVYLHTTEGEPVALAEFAQGELRPFRVFNL
ncbi:MAG: tRNA pseudouridine(55) synthase TruB [Alphaproteobacteria bacterium]|nr:tRNA pseudouridine(55) synthase TruB [Alphaproteobacteria bacterium]MBL6939079.1 tRNA pseudouridine(55) synthase TruB [Alphaproteobacteria bacterium]MBL7099671.1 tRNA pseudouridine(55) synthase TruB [Alphaproteobacteria bacterium]